MRTSLGISGGKFVVRIRETVRCADCGTEYRPRVHAYPELVIALGLVAIVAVVVTGVLWFQGRVDRAWFLVAKLLAALIVAVLGVLASRLQKKLLAPSVWMPAFGRDPEYGELLIQCPRCGSAALSPIN